MSKGIFMKVFFLSLCFIMPAFAQNFNAIPNNVQGTANGQVGNFASRSGCDSINPNSMKVIFKPSCFGANLRGGGTSLNPSGGPIVMNLKIKNGVDEFISGLEIPVKVTWPDSYGQTCTWDNKVNGSIKVSCMINSSKVDYSCSMQKQADRNLALNDSLSCARNDDNASQGAINQDIKCKFFYDWHGTNQAAGSSYVRKSSNVNCGLIEPNDDLGSSVVAIDAAQAGHVQAYGKRGEIIINYNGLPIKRQSWVKNMSTGKLKSSSSRSLVTTSFSQDGKSLTHKIEKSFNTVEQCLTVKAVFLGGNQYCGSYYSPLMLFFNKKTPKFIGRSFFPISPNQSLTYWPEAGADSYFLAIDLDNDGEITSGKELFGNNKDHSNGFESLRRFDKNKDGVINKKDEVFKILLLWKDENGDGISDQNELISIRDMDIESIALDYEKDDTKFGNRATSKERAIFKFKKNGKTKKGRVLDIWFSEV